MVFHQPKPVYGYPYKVITSDHFGEYFDRQTYCENVVSGEKWIENSFGQYNSQTGYAPYSICVK